MSKAIRKLADRIVQYRCQSASSQSDKLDKFISMGKGRKEEIIWRERQSKEPSLCQIRFLDRLELQNRNKDNPDIESPDFLMAFDKNVKHTIINTLNIFYFSYLLIL